MAKTIPQNNRVKVIAEIANAHQGLVKKLYELVDICIDLEVDIIKLQIFKYNMIATKDYYQYHEYKELYFNNSVWKEVISYIKKNSQSKIAIDMLDEYSFELLSECLDKIDYVKITPSIFTEKTFVKKIIDLCDNIFVGIGGLSPKQVEKTLNYYNFKNKHIVLMCGFQGFPTEICDLRLEQIRYWSEKGYQVGYADHVDADDEDLSIQVPIYAIMQGARYIEKHITIDRHLKGHDYYSALEKDSFSKMLMKISAAEIIMGNKSEAVTDNEISYKKLFRYAVAKNYIKANSTLKRNDISFKRTGVEGLTEQELKKLEGRIFLSDLDRDEMLTLHNLKDK
ncbi:MAG: hypothetical protein CMB31_06585 [Euryarchaeota archaeon]|nr:hypothetical protein [Euryarchaeota archaeon]|tara:strand:+ start:46 stop:1062 length:1017 start_codon:yes stop_codon:yes gene_type:complete